MRYMRLFQVLLFAFCLSLNCVMLNLRQNIAGLSLYSFERALQNEIGAFLGGAVWLKMDKYGHYGENLIREMDDKGRVSYTHQPFAFMKEFDPMMEATLRLEPEFSERVALYANSLAFNRNEIEKAKEILQRHLINYPKQGRVYRLYGELGLIASTLEQEPEKAIRYFTKAFQALSVLEQESLVWEDWFNIRYYGLTASKAAYELKDLLLAYEFHRAGLYVEGEEGSRYQEDMNRVLRELGHEQIKLETLKFANRIKLRHQADSHNHDHAHDKMQEHNELHGDEHDKMSRHDKVQGNEHNEVHDAVQKHDEMQKHKNDEAQEHECTLECNHEAKDSSYKQNAQEMAAAKAENLRKREAILRERFIYMLPGVNKNLFFPIESGLLKFFSLCCFLQLLVFLGLRKRFREF